MRSSVGRRVGSQFREVLERGRRTISSPTPFSRRVAIKFGRDGPFLFHLDHGGQRDLDR